MKRENLANREYYHIVNRGNNKQIIFRDTRDYVRFLFLLLYGQSNITIYNIGRYVNTYIKHRIFKIPSSALEKITENRTIELIAFTCMPNHFHLVVTQLKDGGISNYMQRIQIAYTKYFNTKYNHSGHLLSGPYRITHITDNTQLLHTVNYVHKNPKELFSPQKRNYKEYSWSSCTDYVQDNRWGTLLKPDIILDQFNTENSYENHLETSSAKETA